MLRVYQDSSGKQRIPKSVRIPGTFMSRNNIPKNFAPVVGMVQIGKGKEGKVYAGYMNVRMKNLVAVKKYRYNMDVNKDEYFAKKFKSVVPEHVPNVRSASVSNMTTNMYRGGSLYTWLKTVHYTDELLRSIILQVLGSLYKIQLVDPSFRHNDLHLDNIFVDDRYASKKSETLYKYTVPYYGVRVIIADFGFATDKDLPLDAEFPDYGIVKNNDSMYDVHTFLNAIWTGFVRSKYDKVPQTYEFLERYLQPGWRMKNGPFVKEFRLKAGKKFPYKLREILNDSYFKKDLVAPFYKRSPVGPRRVTKLPSIKKRSPVPRNSPVPSKSKSPNISKVQLTRRNKNRITERKREILKEYEKKVYSNLKAKRVNSPEAQRRAENKASNYEMDAQRLAERNVRAWKYAGLVTPSPEKKPTRVSLGPAIRPAVAPNPKKEIQEFIKKQNVEIIRPATKKIDAPPPAPKVNVSRSPGGTIRVGRKKCMGYKKDELLEFAKKMDLKVSSTMTKETLCGKLIEGPSARTSPVKKPGPKMTLASLARYLKNNPPKTKTPPKAKVNVSKSPGGTIRVDRRKCMGYKKDELLEFAKKLGIEVSSTMSKQILCDRLIGDRTSPVKKLPVSKAAPAKIEWARPVNVTRSPKSRLNKLAYAVTEKM